MSRQSPSHACGVVLLAVLVVTTGRPGDARAQEPADASAGPTCDAVLTQEEAAAIVGDSYAGPAVDEPRPGFTRCQWQGDDSNDATFEMDVSVVETEERKRELLPGIGQKAAIVSLGDDAMLLEVARADGVARVILYKVARDKAVLLARAIAEP